MTHYTFYNCKTVSIYGSPRIAAFGTPTHVHATTCGGGCRGPSGGREAPRQKGGHSGHDLGWTGIQAIVVYGLVLMV
jgi:hypothetical protein